MFKKLNEINLIFLKKNSELQYITKEMANVNVMHLVLFAVFFALLAPTGALGAPLLNLLKGLPVVSEILASDMGTHAFLGVVFYFVTLYVLPMIARSKFGEEMLPEEEDE